MQAQQWKWHEEQIRVEWKVMKLITVNASLWYEHQCGSIEGQNGSVLPSRRCETQSNTVPCVTHRMCTLVIYKEGVLNTVWYDPCTSTLRQHGRPGYSNSSECWWVWYDTREPHEYNFTTAAVNIIFELLWNRHTYTPMVKMTLRQPWTHHSNHVISRQFDLPRENNFAAIAVNRLKLHRTS